jgi:hypothetical protein
VREIFLRYRANDISLANDILDRVVEQVREDELRVQLRDETTARNKELAREGKKAGCRGWEYAELHNSGLSWPLQWTRRGWHLQAQASHQEPKFSIT